MSQPTTIELDMGLSEKDFSDVLSNAVKPYGVTETSDGYALKDEDRRVHIKKTILPPRVIASFKLPRMMVTLTFPDHSEQEIAAFMQRFNRYMHRGGG